MLWHIDMIVLFWLVLGMLPPWDRFQLPFTILFMGFDRAEHCWSKFILFVKPNIANMNQEIWKSTVDFRRVLAVKIIINLVHLKTQMQQWTRKDRQKRQNASKIWLQLVRPPFDSVQLVHITPITMVYGTYNYSYWGL